MIRLLFLSIALLAALLAPAFAQSGPSNVSVTPSAGSGASQTFAFTSSSPNGYGDISIMQMIFNSGVDINLACYLVYYQASNQLYLYGDQGSWAGGGIAGTPGQPLLSNSQCQVNVATATVSNSFNALTLTVTITFQPAFLGPQNIYMETDDNAGQYTNWQQMGTWTGYAPISTQPPTATVTPTAGTGLSQIFTYTISDLNGSGYVPYFFVLFPTGPNGANACDLMYNQTDNLLELYNDAGTAQTTAAPGSGTVLSNSQCSLSAAQSTVSASGNNLVVGLAVTFASSFAGVKNNNVFAVDHAGEYAGWQTVGTWTVGTPADFTIGITPSSQAIPVGALQPVSYAVSMTAAGGFNSPVALTVTGLPASGISAFWSNQTISGSSQGTLTIAVNPNMSPNGASAAPTPGVYPFTITGVSGSLSHTVQGVLIIQPSPFTLTLSQSPQTVVPGATASFNIQAFSSTGYNQPIGLTWADPNTGLSQFACYQRSGVLFSITLPFTMTAGQQGVVGTITPSQFSTSFSCYFAIRGSGGGTAYTLTGELDVGASPDYSITPSGGQTVTAPGQGRYSLNVSPVNGFTGTVSFSAAMFSTAPAGITFDPINPVGGGSGNTAMTVHVPAAYPPGTYGITIFSSSSAKSHNVSATLTVLQGADFTITATNPQTVVQGGSASYTILLTPLARKSHRPIGKRPSFMA